MRGVRFALAAAAVSVLAACGGGGETPGESDAGGNSAPVWGALPAVSLAENETKTVTLSATDSEGDSITFALGSGAPAFASLSGSTLTLAPGYAHAGSYAVALTASDATGSSAATLQVTVTNANRAPLFPALNAVSIQAGSTQAVTLGGSDPDGDALSYSITSPPAWASLTGNVLALNPGADVVGAFSLEVAVTDGTQSATQTLSVTVTNALPQVSNLGQRDGNGGMVSAGGSAALPPRLVVSGSDPEGGSLSIDVELRPVGTAFSDTATHSQNVNAQGQATFSITTLPVGSYHWQSRARDAAGQASAWASFAGGGTGFVVVASSINLTFTSASALVGTRTPAVTVTASSDGGAIATMRFKEGSGAFGAEVPYAASTSLNLSAGDGLKSITVEVKDATGNTAQAVLNLTLDETAPTGTVTLNGTDPYVKDNTVNVLPNATDPSGTVAQCLKWTSAPPAANDPCWEPITGRTLMVPASNQLLTIYAWFRDPLGNTSAAAATDTILHDSLPPTLVVTGSGLGLNGGADYVGGTSVVFNHTASAGSGSPLAQVCLSVQGSGSETCTAYANAPSVALTGSPGPLAVFLTVTDAAGNSAFDSDGITWDNVAPQLASMTGPGGWQGSRTVTPAFTGVSDQGSGLAGVQYSENGTTWGATQTWNGFLTAPSYTFSSDGSKTLYARMIDLAGNTSTPLDVPVQIDTTAPIPGAIAQVGGDGYTATANVQGTLVLPADDSGIYKVCIYIQPANQPAPDAPTGSGDSACVSPAAMYNITLPSQGTWAVYAFLIDNADNITPKASAATATIVYDSVAPTTPATVTVTPGHRKLTVSWTASSDATSGLAGYELAISTIAPSFANNYDVQVPANQTSYVFSTNIRNNVTYYVNVRAKDLAGTTSGATAGSGKPTWPTSISLRQPTASDLLAAVPRNFGMSVNVLVAGKDGSLYEANTSSGISWKRLDPLFDGTIRGIAPNDPTSSEVYIVGDNGFIAEQEALNTPFVRATNNQPAPQSNLYGVARVFNGANTYYYAVGGSGTVLQGQDVAGGGNFGFYPITSPTNQTLRAIASCGVGENQAVAVGDNGAVVKVNSFGVLQASVLPPSQAGAQLKGVASVASGNSTYTIAIGEIGGTGVLAVAQSLDCGSNWSDVDLSAFPALSSVYGVSLSKLSDGALAFSTVDSATGLPRFFTLSVDASQHIIADVREKALTGVTAQPRAASFGYGNMVLVVGDGGEVFSGDFWDPTFSHPAAHGEVFDVRGFGATFGLSHVWAVGSSGSAYLSTNAGATWTAQALPAGSKLAAVQPLSSSDVVAVGEGGRILRYNGTSWAQDSYPASITQDLNDVDCEGTDCFIVGQGGVIVRGPTTWNVVQAAGGPGALYDVEMFVDGATSQNRAVAVGTDGNAGQVLFFNGSAWNPLGGVSSALYLSGISVSGNTWIAVGQTQTGSRELILRSTNNGASWTTEYTGTVANRSLSKVTSPVPGTFYAVGTAGTLLKSTDDGDTWTVVPAYTSRNLLSVLPVTSTSLLMGSDFGAVYSRTNTDE